ncbi:hypothetical protein ACSLBF_19505 (plasmid) [Pseudoalteromonas sp. T1lg65]|uniref:hypothetical protein n=1 Tax=Pseudoalteromonas sp. T1lg65 TaxID=2077101 RepID=UPI003F7AFFEE
MYRSEEKLIVNKSKMKLPIVETSNNSERTISRKSRAATSYSATRDMGRSASFNSPRTFDKACVQRVISHSGGTNDDSFTGKVADFQQSGSDAYQAPAIDKVPGQYRAKYDVNGTTNTSKWFTNEVEVSWDRGHKLAQENGGKGYAHNLFWQHPGSNRGGDWRSFEGEFNTLLGNSAATDDAAFYFERKGEAKYTVTTP